MNPDVDELRKYNVERWDAYPEDLYDRLLAKVAFAEGMTVQALRLTGRRGALMAQARARACRALVAAGLSYPETGRMLGGLHHTSVLHWVTGKGRSLYL